MPAVLPLLLVSVGVCLVALAVLFRLGHPARVRRWVGEDALHTVHLLVPGAGLLLVFFGSWHWLDESPRARGAVSVSGLLGWLLLVAYLAPSRIPLWLLPRWSRDAVRAHRAAQDSPRS